jgi:hypothetical protein
MNYTLDREFNPIRAAAEELTGLTHAYEVIKRRRRDAERRLGEAESEYNDLALIERFAESMVDDARQRLDRLRENAEIQSGEE